MSSHVAVFGFDSEGDAGAVTVGPTADVWFQPTAVDAAAEVRVTRK